MAEYGDWDVNKYYNEYEPKEQWELKRKFMEANKHSLPEDKTVCLAQVLVNVEFLGCRYPNETMRTLVELSADIVEEFRERQKGKLKRTFVGAADAASAKFKGGNFPSSVQNTSKNVDLVKNIEKPEKNSKKKKSTEKLEDDELEKTESADVSIQLVQKKKKAICENLAEDIEIKKPKKKKRKSKEIMEEDVLEEAVCVDEEMVEEDVELGHMKKKKKKSKMKDVDESVKQEHFQDIPKSSKKRAKAEQESIEVSNEANDANVQVFSYSLPNFVIIQNASQAGTLMPSLMHNILQSSSSSNGTMVEYKCEWDANTGVWTWTLLIDKQQIAISQCLSKKEGKKQLLIGAFEALQSSQYVLQVNDSLDNGQSITAEMLCGTETVEEPQANNIGDRLMRMMGWRGGGLGPRQQGISKPVEAETIVGRSGLGFIGSTGSSKNFRHNVRRYLSNYVNSESQSDLIFSSEFTSDERAIIHDIARKMLLKSKSRGQSPNRRLVISRSIPKLGSLLDFVKFVHEKQTLGELDSYNEKFSVFPPGFTCSN